ncbi:MAG: homoserine dehydrogenase, partial [Gemmatimonadota bacterium]|nr:homoserine dehydrogenase [Gemmatimonadota bacterium]
MSCAQRPTQFLAQLETYDNVLLALAPAPLSAPHFALDATPSATAQPPVTANTDAGPALVADTSAPAWPVVDTTITIRDFTLESGTRLDRVDIRYRLEGAISAARDNVVLVVHALTGTPDASSWWRGVIGAENVLSPHSHAILCANLLGGCAGTSGPRTDETNFFPNITTRDQAASLARLLDELNVRVPLLICGGSLGGMVTLEFAASFPDRVRQAVVLAAPAAQTAQALAWHTIMRRAIAIGGAEDGLALARMTGMLSYRTSASLEERFGRNRNAGGLFEVNEWLYAHGDRLVQRFDASSYVGLIDAMDAHDVGRGRNGISAALTSVADRLIGVGIPGDILYSAESVRAWCEQSGAEYRELSSPFGHDAFLLETDQVSAIISDALQIAAKRAELAAAAPVHRWETGVAQQPLRIALAGCGNVGGALLDLLSEQADLGAPQRERSVVVTNVLVRNVALPRPGLSAAIQCGIARQSACITNAEALLHGNIDVLVEAIGGTTTSHALIETALKRGIRVVTANKALVATRGPALLSLAQKNQTSLGFEGAVAAAIPVIRCLRAGSAGVGISSVTGILNGTTNVVLERVANGQSLNDAVAHAQRAGFAESDPSRDLSGEDAEDKLRILAWLAFGVDPASLRVIRRGVDRETAEWANEVAREGDRVKLIASCRREGGALVARVVPTRVSGSDAWATVTGAGNRIVIESESAGALVMQGPGAGGRATAGAIYG